MEQLNLKPLIDEAAIQTAVEKLANQIAADYSGRSLTILGVLTGSIILLSDLIRKMDIPLRVGLLQASSYRGDVTNPGDLKINSEMLLDIKDRDILLVDDIFDTGRTLQGLIQHVHEQSPLSVRSAVLLWKEGRSKVTIEPDYHCFRIPNKFVVGYGLDYNDEYRHLPYIAELDENENILKS